MWLSSLYVVTSCSCATATIHGPPPPKKQQKQVTKEHFRKNNYGWYAKKGTKQGRNDNTILLQIVIPISFAIFPTAHTHQSPACHTSHISSQYNVAIATLHNATHMTPSCYNLSSTAMHTLDYIHVPLIPHSTPRVHNPHLLLQ